MKRNNLNFVFPLPPEQLHARYDPVFTGLKHGLSTTLIGLPESHRSSYLKSILYGDTVFLNEFIDTSIYKMLVIEEPIRNSLDLMKSILFKLRTYDIFSEENRLALHNAIASNDTLLCLLVLEDVLKEIRETHRLIIMYYHTDMLLSHDSDIIPTLAKIWGMHRAIPDPLFRFLFIASPVFLEQLGDTRLSHIRGMFEEQITYFPLFNTEEMAYTRDRSQAILHITIPDAVHELSTELSGGHPVLYRSLMYLPENRLKEITINRQDPLINGLIQTIWKGLPVQARMNWQYDNLSKVDFIIKLGFLDAKKIKIPLLPPPNLKVEKDIFYGEIPQLTAQQKVVYDLIRERSNQVISREEIAQVLWGKLWQEKYSDWAIDKCMSELKKKLAPTGESILTLRKRGYKYNGNS